MEDLFMNILVLGNGFDLAHGLPTKYEHFLEFVDIYKKYRNILIPGESRKSAWEKEEGLRREFLLYLANLCDQKKKIFAELAEMISENIWIDYFLSVFTQMKQAGREGWIDFESEIARVIQTLDDVRIQTRDSLRLHLKSEKMTPYQIAVLKPFIGEASFFTSMAKIDSLKDELLDDLNKLIRCLEIYLCDYVERIPIEKKLPDIEALDIDAVVSFNYTDTYRANYISDPAKEVKCDFIHGRAEISHDKKTSRLVIGIDEYLEGSAREADNEYIQFKKFFQRIYKGTGCDYVDWLEAPQNSSEEEQSQQILNIYIYGHSLDVTDKDVLKALITAENAKTTIFYHSQKALEQQIINLVKVITEDELIRRTGGIHRSIKFQPITE